MAKSPIAGRKRVVFRLRADKGSEVLVAGSFNGWDPGRHQLKPATNGEYRLIVYLPKGRYEYKFVVNGTWCVDPECEDWQPNGMGSINSVIDVR